jgi:hypothetical protein
MSSRRRRRRSSPTEMSSSRGKLLSKVSPRRSHTPSLSNEHHTPSTPIERAALLTRSSFCEGTPTPHTHVEPAVI